MPGRPMHLAAKIGETTGSRPPIGKRATVTRFARRWGSIGLAVLGAFTGSSAWAECRSSGDTSLAMPVVTWLRDYRVKFSAPTRLAVDSRHRLLVVDGGKGEIVVRSADGAVVDWRRGLGKPVSVAVDGRGNIADDGRGNTLLGFTETGRVSAYDANWYRVYDLGRGINEFAHPGDIVVDPANGEIFVVDTARHEVKVFHADGRYSRSIGGPAPAGDAPAPEGQFRVPTGIALHENRLFVADQLNFRVQVFDKTSGAPLYCLGSYRPTAFFNPNSGPARTFGMAQGLWVDQVGRLFVADAYQGQVSVIDATTGKALGRIGEFGPVGGQMQVPTDLVIDSFGRLFVSAANSGKIAMFGLDAYHDGETSAPALLSAGDAPSASPPGRFRRFVLTLPQRRLSEGERAAIRINGLPPDKVGEADLDGDGEREILVDVDAAALAAAPGAGTGAGVVTVTGRVGELRFEASTTVADDAGGDRDGDGVPDTHDRCPATAVAEAVDRGGCALAQVCPCRGPAAGGPWRSRQAYTDCLRGEGAAWVAAGLIGSGAFEAILTESAMGACGRPGS